MASLYADEDVPFPIVERLRRLGHDVLTAFEAGKANQSIEDVEQLSFATSVGRVVLTRNRRHYAGLHRRSALHAGIISITDDADLDGQASRIDKALADPAPLANQHVRVNRPSSAKP